MTNYDDRYDDGDDNLPTQELSGRKRNENANQGWSKELLNLALNEAVPRFGRTTTDMLLSEEQVREKISEFQSMYPVLASAKVEQRKEYKDKKEIIGMIGYLGKQGKGWSFWVEGNETTQELRIAFHSQESYSHF